MVSVHDLRCTLTTAAVGGLLLGLAALEWSTGASLSSFLFYLATGLALLALVVDGVQRRLRGDPRTREPSFDDRTLASVLLAALGLLAVGGWSASEGHPPLTWRPLVLLGLALLVAAGWKRRARQQTASRTAASDQ